MGYDHGAGPTLDVAHVRPGEQRVAADPLDDPGHDFPRRSRFHVGDEHHALHRQRRLRYAHDLEPTLAIVARMDEVNRAPGHARELHRHFEGPAARVAPIESHRDRLHGRGQATAHDHATLGDADERDHRRTERFALGRHPATPHQNRVRGLGEFGELYVRIAGELGRLDVQARRQHPLARPVEHRGAVRPVSVTLAHVGHNDGAPEPLPEQHRLLERRIGPRAAVESHQQTREHG